MAMGLNNSIKARRSSRSDPRERQVKAKPKDEHTQTPSDMGKECCISSSNITVCEACSAQSVSGFLMAFTHFLLRVKWPTAFYRFVKAVTEYSLKQRVC